MQPLSLKSLYFSRHKVVAWRFPYSSVLDCHNRYSIENSITNYLMEHVFSIEFCRWRYPNMFDDVELALKKNTAMLVLVYVHLCPFNKSTYNAKESLISAPISSIFKHPSQIFNTMLYISCPSQCFKFQRMSF